MKRLRTKGERATLVMALWVCALAAFPQQPAFFKLGEAQFSGTQIYDVVQDRQNDYWFATSTGLFRFNGSQFRQVDCPEAQGSSFFNLVADSKGVLYCSNLNNQIFRIEGGKCSLFHALEPDEGNADVRLAITPGDELMVVSKGVKIIGPDGSTLHKAEVHGHYLGPPFLTKDGRLIVHLSRSDSLLTYADGRFTFSTMKQEQAGATMPEVLQFVEHGGNTVALDLIGKTTWRFADGVLSPFPFAQRQYVERTGSVRVYPSSAGLWIAGTLPGVALESTAGTYSGNLYGRYFISDVYEDREGNLLLSTFYHGVLVITDMRSPDVIGAFKDDPVTALYADDRQGLYLGSSQGQVLHVADGHLSTLSADGTRPVNVLEGRPESPWVVFDNGKVQALNKQTGRMSTLVDASLKTVAFAAPDTFFIGTNRGAFRCVAAGTRIATARLHGLEERIYFLQYDTAQQTVYAATAHGLFAWRNGEKHPMRYKGREVFATGLAFHAGELYVPTRADGVLVWRNWAFNRPLVWLYGNKPITVRKMAFAGHAAVADAAEGFFRIDLGDGKAEPLHAYYGIEPGRITDFDARGNALWVSHAGGVQRIDLDHPRKTEDPPSCRIEQVLVNNRPLGGSALMDLDYAQNKVQFAFTSNSLRSMGMVRYHYRLLGHDTAWQAVDPPLHQVVFNALSPGDYTFEVRAGLMDGFGPVEAVPFRILDPWYARWWFLLIAGLCLAGAVLALYLRQLRVQAAKLERVNEVNLSKLAAIRSQMNPHFIFNALNSIQDLILKGDVEHSYGYVTTFSQLVRTTLDHSDKNFIDLEQEVRSIELYLSLEKLRFKEELVYEVAWPRELDVRVPPMLVQPFIENALVHGLLHKAGEKRLYVKFVMGEHLQCIIEDNGIGREAVKKIQERQRKHASFAGGAIRKRLDILGHLYQGSFGYRYEDLTEDGRAVGTRVILTLPFQHPF